MFAGLWFFQVRQSRTPDDGFLAVSVGAAKDWFQGLVARRAVLALADDSRASASVSVYAAGTLREKFSEEAIEGTSAVYRIMSVFLMVSVFWALFDQHASSWIRQAEMMNRHVSLPWFGEFEFLPSQIQSLNPILVMILIPLLSYRIQLSPLKKMSLGMFIASLSFVAVALIQHSIDISSPGVIHVAWQLLPYFLITLAEVFVSITGLEFAYTQAPKRMKSTIMGFWLLTVAFGNVLVALTARFSHLKLANFFWVFAGLMAAAAALFSLRAAFYVKRDYHQ
jgi:POT family proton-dependent oligopeptide transporter